MTKRTVWVQREKEALAEIMLEHGIEWEQKGEHREHLSVLEYKREHIEAKPLPLSSKVALEREDYQALVTAVQKFVVQGKQERKLKKLLSEAKKTISTLKNIIADLKAQLALVAKELKEYKSVRGKLRIAEVEQENDNLRSKLHSYEAVIDRNNLWAYFTQRRGKTHMRDDTR